MPSVEINPSRTDVSDYATVRLALTAARALDAIWQEYSDSDATLERQSSA